MTDETAQREAIRGVDTASILVDLVDTLVTDFDVIDILTELTSHSVQLLGAAAAGILLADGRGHLRVIGASTERIQLLELFQVQNEEGPCLDCYNSGQVVINANLALRSPWPAFAAESLGHGYPSVCAVPLRLGSQVLGCLNMFMAEPVELSHADVVLAQALADLASLAIARDPSAAKGTISEARLQHALDSRIAIEQAKGMISEQLGVDMDEAFARLRAVGRHDAVGLTAVAEAIVARTFDLETLAAAPPATGAQT